MKLLWTKSNQPLSVFIRALTGEDCSHFAFVLYEDSIGPLLYESNLLGTHPKFYQTYLKHCEVVHEVPVPTTKDEDDVICDRIIQTFDGKPYDFGGALYIAWRTILKRLFGIQKPSTNLWAASDKFYCDEIFDAIRVPSLPAIQVSGGMDTPFEVYMKILNSKVSTT